MTDEMICRRFGRLLVLSRDFTKGPKHKRWNCRCDCGAELSILSFRLLNGAVKSCGCFRAEENKKPYNDFTGLREGTFSVVSYFGKSKWNVQCDCGQKYVRSIQSVGKIKCTCKVVPPKEKRLPRAAAKASKRKTDRKYTKPHDLTGKAFGKLTVQGFIYEPMPNGAQLKKWKSTCSCGGSISSTAQRLLEGRTTNCGCEDAPDSQSKRYVNAHSTERFVSDAQNVHGTDKYDYSEVVYLNSEDKVNIKCNICSNSWWVKPRLHKMGKGCPSCATSGFKADKPGSLYVMKSETYTKVGITNRPAQIRANQLNSGKVDKFEIVEVFSFDVGQSARDLENAVLRYLRNNYEPAKEFFDGWRESFKGVDCPALLQTINELIATITKVDYDKEKEEFYPVWAEQREAEACTC